MQFFESNISPLQLEYLKIIVTILVAAIGWIIAHYFTTKRDVSTKRRELVTSHLIDTYRILTTEISHRKASPERLKKLEIMVADIQLFGSSEQIELCHVLMNQLVDQETFELDPLINSLRKDLRNDLGLCKVEHNVYWIRAINEL